MNITQKPHKQLLPTGSDIIFVVQDNTVVLNVKGKYVAEVYIGTDAATLTAGNPTCILKVNPNSTGVGIFDFGTIFDNYVSPDYEGGQYLSTSSNYSSQYNQVDYSSDNPHSIHQIDDFCTSKKSVRYFQLSFYTEYASSYTEPVEEDKSIQTDSGKFIIFNGYLDYTDVLQQLNLGYNYNFSDFNWVSVDSSSKFLTYSPVKQYVRENDYATVAFFNNLSTANSGFPIALSGSHHCIYDFSFSFYDSDDLLLNTVIQVQSGNKGGYFGSQLDSYTHIVFGGVGPANLTNNLVSLPAGWAYYEVWGRDANNNQITQKYEYHKQTDDCKGYETIRLTWLNKWGVWDYYNFTKKSIRKINKKPVHYHQIEGIWSEEIYQIRGYKGGKRVLNNAASEEITINTDYITEGESLWLEQLFVSSDVYILQVDDDADSSGTIRKFLDPVIIKSTSYIRKTTANDQLIQYSIDLEKSRSKRTHKG